MSLLSKRNHIQPYYMMKKPSQKATHAFNIIATIGFTLSFMVLAFVWGYLLVEMIRMIHG